MDFSKTNDYEVRNVLELINNRPRKFIKFKTPLEKINEYMSMLHLN